ncbi:RNA-binding S4 domain-containing protein [Sneathiella sp.]|uniref:RNA-binding S4 domain-containing protein n=1 Tax=Sneathiella sp. TaxID=1964365 RepID=UPI00356A2F51
MNEDALPASANIRVDKWLWYARFFKSRSLAAKMVQSRKLRLNSIIQPKASTAVKADDILTFAQDRVIRVIKIRDIGVRRGPAPEAQKLYEDLAPPEKSKPVVEPGKGPVAQRDPGSGRPTKADRRALDKLRSKPEEEM